MAKKTIAQPKAPASKPARPTKELSDVQAFHAAAKDMHPHMKGKYTK